MQCRALVLSGFGINCEDESKFVVEKTGGAAEIVHINELIEEPSILNSIIFLFFRAGLHMGTTLALERFFQTK